jgi:hypothetical protein
LDADDQHMLARETELLAGEVRTIAGKKPGASQENQRERESHLPDDQRVALTKSAAGQNGAPDAPSDGFQSGREIAACATNCGKESEAERHTKRDYTGKDKHAKIGGCLRSGHIRRHEKIWAIRSFVPAEAISSPSAPPVKASTKLSVE